MILEIPRVPPSPNNLVGHWRFRHRNTQLWRNEVYYAVVQSSERPSAPYPKATVSIDRRSIGILDEDNLVASMKPVIDGLRHAGVLLDDSPAHMKLSVTQTQSRKLPPRTRIEIQPV